MTSQDSLQRGTSMRKSHVILIPSHICAPTVRIFRCFQRAIERGANNVTGIVRPTNHGKLLLLHSRIHYHEKPKTRG